jgi:tetratricopeptide (TPR) repeat protein
MKKRSLIAALALLSACSSKPTSPEEAPATESGYSDSGKTKANATPTDIPKPAQTTSRSDSNDLNYAVENGRDEEISKAASTVLAKNPNDAKALNAMGLVHYRRGHLPAALLMFDKAIKADANYSAPHTNRGLVYLSQQEQTDAIKEFRKAIQINSNDHVAGANIGSIYVENKDYPKALVAMEIAYRGNSKDPKILNNYGIALTGTGDYSKAKDMYKKALDYSSGNKDIMLNYAILLIDHMKNGKEGLDLISKIKFLGPSPEVRNRINVLENSAKAGLK